MALDETDWRDSARTSYEGCDGGRISRPHREPLMAVRFFRPLLAGLATLALVGVATAAPARTHHSAPSKHIASTTRHSSTNKRDGRHTAKPAAHRDASPVGVTSVPAVGLKVYCPARKEPLLIRKATQGAGTTVTIVCR